MKKFGAFLLTGALVSSMAVPAFADELTPPDAETEDIETVEGGAEGSTVTSEATLELPTIKVTLPTSHGFIINPYNLENAGQIVSAEAKIINGSDVAVEVSLKSTTAEIDGKDAKLKATLGPVTDKTTTKTVELNLITEPSEGKGSIIGSGGKVNITGKNAAIKLVTLNAEDGEATLTYEGKVVANPAGNPWSTEDSIVVTSVYTFAPVIVTE